MIPRFAVVGHPNKGKSSIVATLAESADVPISDTPGTTTRTRPFRLTIDGEPLYELYDTPGFQRPRQVLAWLQAHAGDAADRSDTVARFVAEHRDQPRYRDECELLAPLLDGAGILYVVDGSIPYGPEYEAEMEILRWTGRPRMALINMIGTADHSDAWRAALDQYFAIVRVFDAQRADFSRRIELLRAFAELSQEWREPLERAIRALRKARARRHDLAAEEITSLLIDALTATVQAEIDVDADPTTVQATLRDRLIGVIAAREARSRTRIEAIYDHNGITREEAAATVLAEDLFSDASFRFFGLSRAQLMSTGAAAGAVTGGGIDVLLGGASLMLGAAVGAIAGATTALLGSQRIAEMKVLGQSLGRKQVQVGPVRDANLPWVLLGRALLHCRLVAERNHARRDALVMAVADAEHAADAIDADMRKRLAAVFAELRAAQGANPLSQSARDQLRATVRTLVAPD